MFSPTPAPSDQRLGRSRATPSRFSRQPESRFISPLETDAGAPAPSVTRFSASGEAAHDLSMIIEGASEMEVDNQALYQRANRARSGVVFAQSEEMSVRMLSQLPAEVHQVLCNADFASDAFTGIIDAYTSFCLIASARTCFVWKYSQAVPGIPTCYIFPCPSSLNDTTVPFSALVSYGPSREPGLILASPYGETRFWDSVGLGLTGGEPTQEFVIDLRSDETITSLIYAEPLSFITTTSSGRLFLLNVTSMTGHLHVTYHTFTLQRPQGVIERLRHWGEVGPTYSHGFITAAAVANMTNESYEVWTCMDTSLVKWTVTKKGWEQLDFEENLEALLSERLLEAFPSARSEAGLDLELLDVAFDLDNKFIILTSFNAGLEDESGMDTRPRRYYVVVRLSMLHRAFSVESLHTVPYQTISSDKANIHPRLRLLSKGLIFAVEFGDAVALVARDKEYSNVLALKSLHDRTFGCGVVDDSSEMLVMSSEVIMKVSLDVERINTFDVHTVRGASIKSIMMQAILFGSNPKNPLLFTFPPDVKEESLISGAEQLSRAVLSSDIEVVYPNPDLLQQILERKERLRSLIGFINENAALGKMSQTSRQRLAIDAEKLYAAQQLWLLYSQRVEYGPAEHVLHEAVMTFMEKSCEGHHEDIMRAFLRLQTREIGNLIPYLKLTIEEFLKSVTLREREPDALNRGADYILCILQSSWSYRDTNSGVYGLSNPMINAWTSARPILDIVFDFFLMMDKQLSESQSHDLDADIVQEARGLFPKLAGAVFRGFHERLEWLNSLSAADEFGIENEKRTFREQIQQLRPNVLHTLKKHSMIQDAFQLAEEYRDFRSLVDLCHSTPPIFPFDRNIHADLIKKYIDIYKEEFTDELFTWYIEHAELRSLFVHSDLHGQYIDVYFQKHPQPTMSWIHDLSKERWGDASRTLLKQSENATHLATRHVMLSIGKLTQIAQSEISPNPAADAILDAFHHSLDYVSVHQKLISEIRAPLAGSKARQSIENQVDIVMKVIAPSLKKKSRQAFLAELRVCVRALLQNHVLDIEDVIDVLTLKEDTAECVTALELIKDAKIPESRRKAALRTIWRRIYIHDDWPSLRITANMTDTQLSERFRRTGLYSTIQDILRRQGQQPSTLNTTRINSLILPLDEASTVPSSEDLSSRWPGHTDEQLGALARDYESEQQTLIWQDSGLLVERVKELAIRELKDRMRGTDVPMVL